MSIATNLQRLVDAKSDIADAITAKGGTVGANDGLEEFPADIATIPSGGEETALNYTTKPVRVFTSWWSTKTWTTFNGLIGNNIWTDGANTYYSYRNDQYVLDGSTWNPKTWSGITIFDGRNIWTDGTNIYFSSGSDQYILIGSTWQTRGWDILTTFDGRYIWTDGKRIYYSYYNFSSSYLRQYVLGKASIKTTKCIPKFE